MGSIAVRRSRRPPALVAAAAAAVVALTLLPSDPAAGRGQDGVEHRAKRVRVEIDDFAFRPRTVRVRRGAKVVFANRDSVAHTATRRGSFDTGRIRPGRSKPVRLSRTGVYSFICSIHPFMRGKVVVR